VPRFAARLTWVSALALLLASTWLYKIAASGADVAQNFRLPIHRGVSV